MADSEKPERKLYRVEIDYVVYVIAESAEEAEKWAEQNPTEWGHDASQNTYARRLVKGEPMSEELLDSLPWVAGGISDEETDKPVRWWRERSTPEK